MPTPRETDHAQPTTFATRRADRDAREAAGEIPPEPRRRGGFRAGVDAENPTLVVRRVQA